MNAVRFSEHPLFVLDTALSIDCKFKHSNFFLKIILLLVKSAAGNEANEANASSVAVTGCQRSLNCNGRFI